ncbi:PAS domain S-box protein [Rhizobium sp. CFBP 8762]|uniref:ATP-binding protein n=1 Tax=Rhizobium sp. CFBP 8762 TaxID=2775279 RepID=UPI00177ECFE3|nr:ATP-binding protein [Rhizobium sp. CFBP 8762]MBD8553409.1 PAS domain S-box protein [Rhizobium sp. CFBP 8762]
MPARQYPFIDIAVHARVREHFARGEAAVLLSTDLSAVLWANGQGAVLFGHASIYDFLESGINRADILFRQMETAVGQLRGNGDVTAFVMRVTAGFSRVAVNAHVEKINLRTGETAILFTVAADRNALNEEACAQRMLSGLDDPDTHMAVLDGNGRIVAASPGFRSLEMSDTTRQQLVDAVGRDRDWLVKRPVSTGRGTLPAAIGKLSDNPALHLLFAVETVLGTLDTEAPEAVAPAADMAAEAPVATPVVAETPAVPEPVAPPVQHSKPAFTFLSNRPAVRFVWKVAADGRFSDVSDEFATAVGPRSANISGKLFVDVARDFGLDPQGEITALLQKRDTWSGKTIFWPVQDTDLVVPVDLAALPTYSRDREFDGFRGFGIVRVADAVEDKDARGLFLPIPEPEVVPEPESASEAEQRTGTPDNNIVSLNLPQAPRAETLSNTEKAAFREIARKLTETFGKGATTTDQSERVDDTASAAAEPEIISAPEPEDDDGAILTPETLHDLVPPRTKMATGFSADEVNALPVAALVHGGDRLFYANAAFLTLTGYDSLDDLADEGGIDALFADQDDGLFELPPGEVMLIRANGRLLPVTARLQSVRWEDTTALMLSITPTDADTGADQDNTPPAKTTPSEPTTAASEKSFRIEADELRSILETATDGVVIVSAEGEIRSLNRSASALFNYDQTETRGKPFAMLFAHESQRAVLDYLAGLSGHGVASVLNDGREVIGREASGGFIPLFMTMGRLSSSNGYCAVIRDITQWKRTEDELRNAKRAAETANAHKTDFLARVSHEIRTPLNAIIGFSDMMANEHFGPIGHPRYIEYANDIGRSGRHVLDIVNDLLDISKIEAGEMDLEFAAVGLNETVSEAVSLVQPQANGQRVIIRTSLSTAVPDVVADLRSIKQMALNILSNSIRFTPPGGQIVVSTAYEANGSVALRIRDTGIGMSRMELEQAMKPFRQVTTGAHKRGDGTGLGLPLTKAMAEANRATFSIQSAPNEGTLVEICFPPQRVLAD